MPTVAYEVIVSQSGEQSENNAVANASSYLSYADQTDTVGYHGNVFDVNVYDGDADRDYGIGLCVAFPIASPHDKEAFVQEMDNLAKVESWMRVHYQPLDKSDN